MWLRAYQALRAVANNIGVMPIENDAEYSCPSCGETNAVGVDPTQGRRQRFVEDCPVCCRPLVFTVVVDRDGDVVVESVERE